MISEECAQKFALEARNLGFVVLIHKDHIFSLKSPYKDSTEVRDFFQVVRAVANSGMISDALHILKVVDSVMRKSISKNTSLKNAKIYRLAQRGFLWKLQQSEAGRSVLAFYEVFRRTQKNL